MEPQVVNSAPSARDAIRRFFNELLPLVIEERSGVFDAAGGRMCVEIHGVGCWIINFGDSTSDQSVVCDYDMDADLVIGFSAPVFAGLLNGEPLDPSGHGVFADGDMKLLQRFGSMLVGPSRGPLSMRLANF